MLLPVKQGRAEAHDLLRQADLKCTNTCLQFTAYECLLRKLSIQASFQNFVKVPADHHCLSAHQEVPGRFGH